MQVYHASEVEAFAKVFYLPPPRLQPARDRFHGLDEDDQNGFRDRLSAFVNLYAFLSQIIPYGDSERERLASFGRLLLPSLQPDRDGPVDLGDDVTLEYYRLEHVQTHAAFFEDQEVYVTSPSAVGTGSPEEEKAPLSEVIEQLNERFGTDFTDEDRLFFEQVKERALRDEDVRQIAVANPFDKFSLGIRERVGQMMVERMGENDALVTRYLSDSDFQEIAFAVLAREIFQAVEAARATGPDS